MECFIATQSKSNEALNESINQLNAKFDAMASHQKAMDTQIAEIAQWVSHLSRPLGHLPGQSKTNPRGHINALSIAGERVKESPIMILKETVAVSDSVGTHEQKERGKLSSNEEIIPPPQVRPYQPLAPYPQKMV